MQEFNATGCHALAGIGNPDRFFKLLASAGLICETHSFPDHYKFKLSDISFSGSGPVLMTEKDAVKCTAFAGNQHWYIPVKAVPETGFAEQLLTLLREKIKPDHVKINSSKNEQLAKLPTEKCSKLLSAPEKPFF